MLDPNFRIPRAQNDAQLPQSVFHRIPDLPPLLRVPIN